MQSKIHVDPQTSSSEELHSWKRFARVIADGKETSIRVARSLSDLMQVVAIRAAVYLSEQTCPYDEEFDGNDFCGMHLIGSIDNEPAACIRIRFFPDFAKTERLAVPPQFRPTPLPFSMVRPPKHFFRIKAYPTINSPPPDPPAPAGASIIDLRAYVDPSVVPILVLVDLQPEYIATARALAVPGAAAALANCRGALTHARAKGFPVAFVRWLARSAFFNPATRFSRWIEGFEPFGSDMVFERGQPSCYASTSFDQVMTECGGNFVLAGFAGEAACLATAVDAFHRGHRITFLAHASASHALAEGAAGDVHPLVSKAIAVYAETLPTRN